MSSQSIYDRFNLPPPPPPTGFSHRRSADRMRLPIFQSVQEAQDFLDALLIYRHDSVLASARVVFACLVAMVFITIVVKEIRYYARKQRWILRLVHIPDGTIIVPNMTSVFASFEALFMGLNCVSNCVHLGYVNRNLATPHLPIWIFFQFIPLWWGTFWSSWASSHARVPGSQRYELIQRRSQGPWMKPLATNCVWTAVPILQATSVVVSMALSDVQYEHARKRAIKTTVQLSAAAELSEEQLISIQEIWMRVRNFAYWAAVSCLLWFIATFGLTILYAILSFRLVTKLREHLSALLQLKQAREVVGTVRMDLMTEVTVSSIGWAPNLPSTFAMVEESREEVLSASPTSGLFPTIAAASAKHEPLGDAKGFWRVIWLYGLQRVAVVAGASSFAILTLVLTIIIVDAAEVNQLERVIERSLLLTQILAAALGVLVIISNVLLERSNAFLTLMHGTYKADQIHSTTSERKPSKRSNLSRCLDAQQMKLETKNFVWILSQSFNDDPYGHAWKYPEV
ncbi:hypothetical protein CF326_g6765 [Tilletia indica]|nr:hypothetical protein CF326_g6765 [Tilletia indica]